MKGSLKEIWKNRKQIFEGISNAIIRDEVVENVSALRYEVCNACEAKGDECVIPGTAPCCNECGCSLSFKTRALSADCPLGKWDALITEEEEDELEEL
jgi:hypothetical protein